VDGEGCIYLTGKPGPGDFPVTSEEYSSNSIYVTKFNAEGSALEYSTMIGGNSYDEVFALDVDKDGYAYITGRTGSEDFPLTKDAYDTIQEDWEGFVTKLDQTGSALIYSTFLGGVSRDYSEAIAVDKFGNAYVTGTTQSSLDFPLTEGAYDTVFDVVEPGFVTKINPSGNTLIYSTLIDNCNPVAITVDASGCVYITGHTGSLEFPVTPGSYNYEENSALTDNIYADAFVTKLNVDGSDLIYSTMFGGRDEPVSDHGRDYAYDIAVDSEGCAYITGKAQSSDFPTSPGAYSTTYNGGSSDAFVSKLNADGRNLIYSTFFGGKEGTERSMSIIIDDLGRAVIAGYSDAYNVPTTKNALFPQKIGGRDNFIAMFNRDGRSLAYASYFGGTEGEEWAYLGHDRHRNIYLAGETSSWDFPITENSYDDSIYVFQPTQPGAYSYANYDVFVCKFTVTEITEVYDNDNAPVSFFLYPPHPNPFNPVTTLRYNLSESAEVTLSVYNVRGQKVATLVAEYQSPGEHHAVFDATGLASGIYFVRGTFDDKQSVKKVVFMK